MRRIAPTADRSEPSALSFVPWYRGAVRILWASPLPPTRSGVSDYAVELLPELARRAQVRVVSPPELATTARDEIAGCPVVDASTTPTDDEIQLLHLGNNPYHEWLLDRLEMPRTAVILHDAVLHHLLVETTLAKGRQERFGELLEAAHPDAGALARARRLGVTGRRDPFLFPARKAFLDRIKLIVVHSRWAEDQVRKDLPKATIERVGLSVADPGPEVDRAAERRRLQIAPDAVLLVHIGFLTPDKGLLEVLGAVAAARAEGIAARLLMVGEGRQLEAIEAAAERLGVRDATTFSGWVPPERFLSVPAAADLGVALRDPSAGETSAAVLRFLACGTPAAVTGVRQFLEWPEAAAPRITPGPSAIADLVRLIREATGRESWSVRRAAARAAYEAEHLPSIAAERLVEVLESADLV